MLTNKQRDLLVFLNERALQSPVAPSFDEMRTHLGLASKSGIHRLLSALEERQFIRRHKARARAIEVLRIPDALSGPIISPADFSAKMREIAESGDTEAAHGYADDLLVEVLRSLGYGEGCDVFEAMHKWYA